MAASLNNYTDPSKIPHELCERIANVLRNPLYRVAQCVNLTESIAALICIIYVSMKYKKAVTLHFNIMLLLSTLYTLCFVHAAVYSISKIYQLYISFYITDACHMFLPKMFYIVTHNIMVFNNNGIRNAQMAMVIERCVATALVNSYEKRCRALGVVLVAAVLLLTSMEVAVGITLTLNGHLMTNSLIHPGSNSLAVTIGLAVLSTLSCLMLMITVSLFCFNLHRKKRKTLTSRYQAVENISMSALLLIISTIQLITFALYTFFMTYIRLTRSEDPLVDAYKEAAYLVPLGTFLIPLGTVIYLKTSKKRRRSDIDGLVKLTTHGQRGYENYAIILNRQWNKKG